MDGSRTRPRVPPSQVEDADVPAPAVLAGGLSTGRAADLARTPKALADPARLRLLSLIAASPTGEACICDLTGPLGLSQPTLSHHCKVLVDAGFLRRDKRGVWAHYSWCPGRCRPSVPGSRVSASSSTPELQYSSGTAGGQQQAGSMTWATAPRASRCAR